MKLRTVGLIPPARPKDGVSSKNSELRRRMHWRAKGLNEYQPCATHWVEKTIGSGPMAPRIDWSGTPIGPSPRSSRNQSLL
jgi:hypothetical protein